MAILSSFAPAIDHLPKRKPIIGRDDRGFRDQRTLTVPTVTWRLEHLPRELRDAAEIASLGAGLSLSAWLTRLINETCTAEKLAQRGTAAESDASQFADEKALPAGAIMLPVAALAPANLGTRHPDQLPEALFADIARRGVRQPLLIRRVAASPDCYEIVCGHRRWRAAQRAKLAQVPATICTHDDTQAVLASLAENLQLGDFSPIEEAYAYLRLLTRGGIDADALTRATGRDRDHVVRTMRLLGLPPLVRGLIGEGKLSIEHAYLLLDTSDPETLARAIDSEKLSAEAARARLTRLQGEAEA